MDEKLLSGSQVQDGDTQNSVEPLLDIDDGTAFWISAGDEQCIDLKAPLLRPAARITSPPPWLISLGRIADPILARPVSVPG